MPVLWRPIQATAQGFLSLLGLKNNGQNPEFLSDTVIPQIDMREWYLMQNHEWLWSDTQPILAANSEATLPWVGGFTIGNLDGGGVVDMAVPQDEWWYVWAISGRVLLDGPDIVDGTFGVGAANTDPALGFAMLAQTTYKELTGDAAVGSHALVGGPVRRWFKPGTLFGMSISYADNNNVGHAMFANLTVEVTRVRL